MCGIATILRFDESPVAPAELKRMGSAIAHRGPDGAAYALLNNQTVGLGHVRLSIVDLAGGEQPLYNEDETIAVICNGEIYDYPQWHEELCKRGHQFRTTSDSELLLHLYEEYGAELLNKLRGEYAFVLWDDRAKKLLAGRDPCGVKPLFYHVSSRELVICSEAKGIYALDHIERKLSTRYLMGPALGVYLDNASAFENIQSLRPGHYLVAKPDGSCQEHEYYRQQYQTEDMSFADAAEGVRERLTTAVKRRLAADVPVHAYLSGGIDSTIIVGLMAESGQRFTCYNVGFPDSPYDESHKARHIARHFGQHFETVPCTHEQIASAIEKAVYCTEVPLNNYNSIAKMALSQFVRSHGQKVCLTGEGSDELFAGYPYFKLEMLWRMQQAGGAEAQRAAQLKKQFRQMEYRSEGLLWDGSERWRRSTSMFGYPCYFQLRARDANKGVDRFFQVDRLGIKREHRPDMLLRNSIAAERFEGLDPFNKSRLLTLNQLYTIVIPLLGDRVEMANSLECRPPFLDRDLLELAGKIPPQYLVDIDNLREKHILREAFGHLLPPVFEKEHKHPFLAPTWTSFARTRAGKPLFEEFLSRENVSRVGIFRPGMVSLLRFLVRYCPLPRGFARKLDALVGTMLNTHILHHLFIENRIACDANFPMKDRSPTRHSGQRAA